MRLILSLAVGLYGLGLGALALFQRHLIYPGAFASRGPEAERRVPPGLSAISIETEDGERLFGLWRAPDPGCGLVLTFHGNASLPEWHAARFDGDPWRAAGWGVLAIGYRGYAGSTGAPSEAGLIEDGLAAYRTAASLAPDAPILLHGHSLGAAVAIAVAARKLSAKLHAGLYLEAPFDSLGHLVALRMPFVPGALLRDTWRSDARIGQVTGPVFIVHGTRDPVIPLKLARRLAEAAGPDTTFTALDGDHVSILGERDREAAALFAHGRGHGCAASQSAQ